MPSAVDDSASGAPVPCEPSMPSAGDNTPPPEGAEDAGNVKQSVQRVLHRRVEESAGVRPVLRQTDRDDGEEPIVRILPGDGSRVPETAPSGQATINLDHFREHLSPEHAEVAAPDNDTVERFKDGFRRYREEVFLKHRSHFANLALGQEPKVMVVSCCDSRVDPGTLLGATPGELFILRNIANLVPPFERQGAYHGTSAALEYAVRHLKVEHIIVLGHRRCGGIQALMQNARGGSRDDSGAPADDFITNWMEIGAAACARTRQEAGHLPFDSQCALCERESINVSLANLLTFPWLKAAVAAKKLQVHGWYYDVDDGSMATWKLRYAITDYEQLN